MAAEVGALRVSLGLDSADFSRSVTDINRKLRAVDSEFKATASSSGVFGNNLQTLKAKQDTLGRQYDLHKTKVAELKRQYDESVATKGKDAKETENLLIKYNKSVTAMNKVEGQLNSVNAEIDQQSSKWTKLSDKLSNASEKFKATGESMSSVGKNLTMSLTAPLTALGAGIVMTGANFEEAMSKVQAISGATGVELEKLEAQAKELGATTVHSSSDAAEGMQFLAMAGFKTNDILSAMPGMLDLATAGALDLGSAADITSNIMSGFGIKAEKAGHIADVLAKAASSANTDVSQLGEAMKYLAPVANTMGWSMEESSAAVMAMSDAGIQGSLAGQAFASSLGRLAQPTKKMNRILEETGISFFNAKGQMKSMSEVIAEVEKGTKGMTDKQKSATLTTLFGAEAYKHWAVLLDKGSDSLKKNSEMLKNADGSAKEMAETMSDNTKGGFKEFQSAVEGLSIQLSEHLLPHVNKGVSYLTDLTRKFGELSPSTQKSILAIGAVTAVIPPLLIVGGHLITAFGAITGVVSTASAAIAGAGGLGAALTALAMNPIGLAIGSIAGLTLGGIALHNHMKKDVIPEIDRFGDSVSEATQKAVGSFLDLNDKATLSLNQLNWSGKNVTSEMATSITTNFDQMGNQIVQGLETKKNEALNVMQELFKNSTTITENEQKAMLESVQQGYDDRANKTEEGTQKIKEIMAIASEEKRALTKFEQSVINSIQDEMVNTGIETLTENEREQKVIFERMKLNASELSALQAAEVVKNSVGQKDQVIAEAEEQYNRAIAEIIKLRDEAGTISEEQADKLIKEAERQKNKTITNAEDMHNKVVKEAQNQATEHLNHVNWETGEVLSKWQVFKKDTAQNWNEMVTNTKAKWKEKYNEIKTNANAMKTEAINEFNEIRDKAKTKFNEAKENILTPIKEAKDKIEKWIGEIKSFFSNLKLKIPTPELPKLPKFSLNTSTTSVMGKEITYPTGFNVKWHKTGGVFTKPVIYGNAGFGDVAEAIIPFSGSHADRIAGLIAKSLGKITNDSGNNVNFERMFDGANFYVRSDNDIKQIAKEIHNLTKAKGRGLGIV